MLDHYIDHNKQFPDSSYMKNQIGHDLALIYGQSKSIIAKRAISMRFLKNLDDPIHQAIVKILSEFALGDRYSNIDLLVGGNRQTDPIAAWFVQVDQPLYQSKVSQKKANAIQRRATFIGAALGQYATVLHTSEMGEEITDIEKASHMTGVHEAVAPYRQLYTVQIIRYWAELLIALQYEAMKFGGEDIPYFSETFALFCNDDSYIRTRKTWDRVWH
jgi:hypothetical protein